MLRFLDGFDAYGDLSATTNEVYKSISGKWNTVFVDPNHVDGLKTVAGKNGDFALSITDCDLSDHIVKYIDNQSTWVVGFWFKFTAASIYVLGEGICSIREGVNQHFSLNIAGSGAGADHKRPYVYVAGSNKGYIDTAWTPGLWYHVEIKLVVHNTTGTVSVKVNGSSKYSFTGDTQAGSVAYANNLTLFYGQVAADAMGACFDHLYILDGQAGVNDSLASLAYVATSYPSADGSASDWTPSNGSDHFAVVCEANPNSSAYVETNNTNDIDYFDLGTGGAGNTVYGLQWNIDIYSTGSGTEEIAALIKQGANEVSANGYVNCGLTEGPITITKQADYQPNTTDVWTSTTIQSAEFGIKKVN